MHLAILMTNTDESAFADAHPKDGEKFTRLIQLARPDWTTEVFSVKDNQFPTDLNRFDGVMITGSPASVRDEAPWVARLLDLIRALDAQSIPTFGACFGHQAIALALGGEIGPNLHGWCHGLTRNTVLDHGRWLAGLPDEVRLYGSHKERVTRLPDTARPVATGSDGTITGFAIAHHVYTTQHHPEMTRTFIAALTDEMAPTLGPDLTEQAHRSLADPSHMAQFAESIAAFFEQAPSPAPQADP